MTQSDLSDHAPRRVNRHELVSALIVLAVALIAIVEAAKLPFGNLLEPDAGFIPMIEASLLACAGIALLVSALVPRASTSISWPDGNGRRIILYLSAALVAYVTALSTLGFAISTALFLWAAISFWRYYSIFTSAILAVVMTSGLYMLFVTILQMSLPHGVLLPL